ncbi:MAG TPA: NrsF family protein [Alphaproteobacteria bacterium]|nr:NrsF family protein [Alphaproteobacteria bacterium]
MSCDNNNNIDQTIRNLCGDLKPMECVNPMRRALLWILLVVTYTTAVALTIGLRENIIEAMNREEYIFELALAFATGIAASLMTFWLTIPDCERYKKFIAVPVTLLSVQVFWMLDRLFFEGMGDIRENWLSHCWMNTLLHTTLPAIAVILLVRKGATVMPCALASFAVLAVSEFGWIGMRLVCPKDNVGEAYFLNFLPYVIIGIVAGFAAKKLFRW